MTYLAFLGWFLAPVIVVAALLIVQERRLNRLELSAIGTLMLLAFVYATPWDNWLVWRGVWSYAPGAVVMVIGHVPLEEYLFFLLQPLMTGLWTILLIRWNKPRWVREGGPAKQVGMFTSIVLTLAGAVMIAVDGSWLYLGSILAWAGPILLLHWFVGGTQLWQNRQLLLLSILPPTVYLSIVDRTAILRGIWSITEETSTGFKLAGLPIEEALFFLITNVMVVQGIVLYIWVVEANIIDRWRVWIRTQLTTDKQFATKRVQIDRIIRMQWGALAICAALALPFDDIPLSIQVIPLLISMVLVGLPHGAVDHFVPGWLRGRSLTRTEMTLFIMGYVLLVGVVLVAWVLAPFAAFVFFILLTWWHWGLGDYHAVVAYTGGTFLDNRLSRGVTALVRGAFPMILPLIFFPGDYALAATEIVAIFSAIQPDFTSIFATSTRLTLLVALVATVVWLLVQTRWRAGRLQTLDEWRRYTIETVLLLVFFAVVPPFLAVGLYFCIWHSVRHILRIIDTQRDVANQSMRFADVLQFSKQAAPLTLISLLMLVTLYLIFPQAQGGVVPLIGLYLALIAALTFPHTLLVMWMDRVQGIWE